MDDVDAFLEHHGVKGMKWGTRTAAKDKAASGSSHPHPKTLSDEELKKHVSRLELEKKYSDLIGKKQPEGHHEKTKKFVKELAVNSVKNAATSTAQVLVSQAVNQALKKK